MSLAGLKPRVLDPNPAGRVIAKHQLPVKLQAEKEVIAGWILVGYHLVKGNKQFLWLHAYNHLISEPY